MEAAIEPGDPLLAGLAVQLESPVDVQGELQEAGEGEYLWRATLGTTIACSCRRCLSDVSREVEVDVDVMFSTDLSAADDPSVYPLPESATGVDLAEAVRQELALAVPEFVLCRDECAGLCSTCGADLNAGPCDCTAAAETV